MAQSRVPTQLAKYVFQVGSCKADDGLLKRRGGICVTQLSSLALQTFVFKMLQVICRTSYNISAHGDRPRETSLEFPSAQQSFLTFSTYSFAFTANNINVMFQQAVAFSKKL